MAYVRRVSGLLGMGFGVAVVTAAPGGIAQTQQDRKEEEATRLFEEAGRRIDAGNWPDACRMYKLSFDLRPTAGRKIMVAECHEHFGMLTVARQDYEETRRLNEPDTNPERKKRRAAAIDEGLARLKRLLPIPTPPLLPQPPPVPIPPSPPRERIAGIAVGSAGIASLAVAGLLTGLAFSKFGQSSPYCTPDNRCYQQGLDLRDDARRTMASAWVLMGTGAAFVTVGAVLFAKAPKPASGPGAAELAVTAGPGDLSLRWRF
jgi:hypothetical protein